MSFTWSNSVRPVSKRPSRLELTENRKIKTARDSHAKRKITKKRKVKRKTKTRKTKKRRKITDKESRKIGSKRPITRLYKHDSPSKSDTPRAGDRVGLPNIGNTCFLSAVIQCLCHTKPLIDNIDVLLENLRLCETKETVGDQPAGKLIEAFVDLISCLSSGVEGGASPDELRDGERKLMANIRNYAPQFSDYSQQDAQELLRYLLLGLHEDLNKILKSAEYPNGGGLIFDLFCGQLKSTLQCTECGRSSETYECFWDLSLPIPKGRKKITLHECLTSFLSLETLDGLEKPMCENCNKRTTSTKRFEINRFPVILVIHIKRFSCSGKQHRYKLNAPVDYGHLMDVSSSAPAGCAGTLYKLYGIVDHYGTISSGHYTAKCKEPNSGLWYKFNDMEVTAASADELVSKNAYLLFYEQDRGGAEETSRGL